MENKIAIKVENLSKEYRLGAIGGTTLREELHRCADKIFHRNNRNENNNNNNNDYGKKFLALQNINLVINKGERVGIIGRNGAGKSTLLKLLSRITAPTTGTISYNGRISSMLEVGTGFHRELTGRENVYMNGAILGMSKREIDSKIDDIIAFAEMEQFIDTPVKRYSSGMYVKLAFSVAAHLNNEILIMDEVLAVGDMKYQQKCLEKMDYVSKNDGRTILFVSHNMSLISQLCERCILLEQGQIVFDGPTPEAITRYLGGQEREGQRIFDLAAIERNRKFSGVATMSKLELLNDDNVIDQSENLHFKLWIRSTERLNDVHLRIYVNDAQLRPIGIFTTQEPLALEPGECAFDLQCNVDALLPGKYSIGAYLYQPLMKRSFALDRIPSIASFTKNIVPSISNTEIIPRIHGYFNFGAPHIIPQNTQNTQNDF